MTMEKPSMREMVIAVGGAMLPGENRKSWLGRVAQWSGLSPRVVRAAYYEETTSRIAAAKLKAAAGNHEADNLVRQFEGLAASLSIRDASFYGPHVDACRDIARILRSLPSADR